MILEPIQRVAQFVMSSVLILVMLKLKDIKMREQ